jgi:hypothetical protein
VHERVQVGLALGSSGGQTPGRARAFRRRCFAGLFAAFAVARLRVRAAIMEWRLDHPTGTLEVTFNRGAAPSREEVGAFFEQIQPLLSERAVRTLLVNGERLAGRGPLTYPDIACPVLYEAARRRTLEVQYPPSERADLRFG